MPAIVIVVVNSNGCFVGILILLQSSIAADNLLLIAGQSIDRQSDKSSPGEATYIEFIIQRQPEMDFAAYLCSFFQRPPFIGQKDQLFPDRMVDDMLQVKFFGIMGCDPFPERVFVGRVYFRCDDAVAVPLRNNPEAGIDLFVEFLLVKKVDDRRSYMRKACINQ